MRIDIEETFYLVYQVAFWTNFFFFFALELLCLKVISCIPLLRNNLLIDISVINYNSSFFMCISFLAMKRKIEKKIRELQL